MKKQIWSCLLTIFMTGVVMAQNIPVDPSVRIGTLENGMKYYIRKNVKPEKKVEFRLAINAGSILENEEQRGLAHFMEHMNFNGTKNFPDNKLVDFLQSIGIKFGQHLNAYTSFDETVYMLPVPLDKPGNLDAGLLVMEDWAFNALLTDEQINKERGVVLEELRLGLGPDKRMLDKYLPKMLYNSQYAERLPIGKKNILENFKPEVLRKFHKDWYRPDLMAIVVVGDINVEEVEKKIKKNFSPYKNPKNATARKIFELPNHQETLVAIESDPDASFSQVQFIMKDKETYAPDLTITDYDKSILDGLVFTMLNNRLEELVNSEKPPFTYGYVYHGGTYARTKEAFQGFAMTKEGGQLDALKVLLEEVERAKKFGFTANELERAKKELLSRLETNYNNRDKTDSDRIVDEYVRNFLEKEAIPGIAWEYEQYKKILPTVSLSQINSILPNYVKEDSRVVVITGPDKADISQPKESDVKSVFANVQKEELKPYVDRASIESLVKNIPNKGSIVNTEKDDKLGTTTWTLSNGAKVTYKLTDFKEDEIVFSAKSLGGNSIINDQDYVKTQFAFQALDEAGINGYNKIDLTNYLNDKRTSVNAFIGTLFDGISGSTNNKNVEVAFQLIYSYFTGLNYNPAAFNAYKEKQNSFYKNLLSNPQFYFSSEFSKFLNKDNPRFTNIIPFEEDWAKTDYKKAYEIYKEHFANAGNFHFYFVGTLEETKLKEMVNQYIASLPSTGKTTNYIDNGYRSYSKAFEKIWKKGKDPKSMVQIMYRGETKYNEKEDLALNALGEVATIKVIEKLREEEAGIYGGGARGGMSKVPYGNYYFSVQFPCGPENVDKLKKSALVELQKLIDNGPEQKDLDKYKEGEMNDYKTDMKKNSYWLSNISSSQVDGGDKYEILNYEAKIKALTVKDIQSAAKKYLTKNNLGIAILMPEDGWETAAAAEDAKKSEVQINTTTVSDLKDLSAQQIIDTYAKALGGKDKLNAVNTLKMNSTMKVMGMEITGTSVKMTPNKFKVTQNMMGQESVQVFDGKKGYMSQAGQKQDFEAIILEELQKAKMFDVLSMDASTMKSTIIQEDGINYYVLEDKEGSKNYFNANTGLLEKGEMEMGFTKILKWDEVNGIKFPTHMKVDANGQSLELMYSDILVNSGVSETDFK